MRKGLVVWALPFLGSGVLGLGVWGLGFVCKSSQQARGSLLVLCLQGYQELDKSSITQRVQVPNNWVLGFWVIVIIVQVLGRYMIIGYLDP